MPSPIIPLVFAACAFISEEEYDARWDLDGDGVPRPADCDDDDPDIGETTQWYVDSDGDGYGTVHGGWGCEQPESHAELDGDCDDADESINPAATESCDAVDNDCDGITDEDDAIDASSWNMDADGDGFGDPDATVHACNQPAGTTTDASDCDDGDPDVHPGARETCDGSDTDCNGVPDDVPWWGDTDGDGFGNPDDEQTSCEQPSGFVADDSDCDDGDYSVNPASSEWCGDGIDNDCDGSTDEDEAADAPTWYEDADGDGYGDLARPQRACQQPSGFVDNFLDCDDSDAAISPDAEETWYDGLDANCDGASDYDADEDGYDSDAYGGGDCLDDDEAVNPKALEACGDQLDNDCDGEIAGECALSGDIDLGEAQAKLAGTSPNEWAGYHLAAAGDLDDDRIADIAIGSYSGAYLWFGPVSAEQSLTDADVRLCTYSSCASAGHRLVAGAGDINADGIDDLLVAHLAYTFLALGPVTADRALDVDADAIISGVSPYHLCGPGDANGDGYNDLLMSNTASEGTAYLQHGPLTGALDAIDIDVQLSGEESTDAAGYGLSWAGDLDGDGLDDVLVGAPWRDDMRGAVYLLLGANVATGSLADADAILCGGEGQYYAGVAVAGAGDLDADGYGDWVTGTPESGVWVLLGTASGTHTLDDIAHAHLEEESVGDYNGHDAGATLAGAGDVDGDGHDDLLVGDYGLSRASYSEIGCAYVVLGPVSGNVSLADSAARLLGESPGDRAGWAVSAAGDINSDDYDDVLVGAPYQDGAASDAGAAYLLVGGAE